MSDEEREKMLDLLCDKFVYGLSEEESQKLDDLGFDPGEAVSIERTIAALGLVDLDAESPMPASLHEKLLRGADEHFKAESVEVREIVLSDGPRVPWFGWLGWAAAAVASIALAVTLFTSKGPENRAALPGTPPPTPEERLDPAQQRQKLIESDAQVIMAQWGETGGVSGDVVWSDAKQAGYMRVKGLAKNDVSKETYQLWIFDETQSEKTPIDGGVFDINTDGEVIVPIDAKLKVKNPGAFAITIEKPGGVVVSTRGRVAALAPVKPAKV